MKKERFYNSLKISKLTRVVCYKQKNISALLCLLKERFQNSMTISKFTRIVCYEKKKIWPPQCLRKDLMKISNFIRICMEKHLTVTG